MTRDVYEVRVLGSLGPAAQEAFAYMSVDGEPTTTVLTGALSQSDLHALLDRIRGLGLELIDVRQAPPGLSSSQPTGSFGGDDAR
jgi:hypothetical protein